MSVESKKLAFKCLQNEMDNNEKMKAKSLKNDNNIHQIFKNVLGIFLVCF